MDCREARELTLEALTGSVTPDRRRELAAHLEHCDTCRRHAQEWEETVALLRAVPEPHPPESHWPQFMAALDRRLQRETTGWHRFVRWLRTPRIAWSTAAATSALVVGLGIALLVQPVPQVEQAASEDARAYLRGFVTDSVAETMPSVTVTLSSWEAGLNASEVPYEPLPSGGE